MATQRQLQYRAQQGLRGNTPPASDVWRWQGFTAPGIGRITNASGVEIIAPVQGNCSTAIGAQVLYIPGQPTGVIRLKEVVVPGVPPVQRLGIGNIKCLYRTGDFGEYEYWVGGDRERPFGPLIPEVIGGQQTVGTIMATGNQLNDWVVCFTSFNVSTRISTIRFVDSTGLLRTRTIASSPLSTQTRNLSKGIIASTDDNTNVTGLKFTTPDDQESGIILPSVGFLTRYFMTKTQRAGANPNNPNLARSGAVSPDLQWGFFARNGQPQELLEPGPPVPTSERIIITPSIDIDPSISETSFVNLLLYSHPMPIGPNPTEAVLKVPTQRWQINEDGTWNELTTVNLKVRTNVGFELIDASYHP